MSSLICAARRPAAWMLILIFPAALTATSLAQDATLQYPLSVAALPDGSLVVADSKQHAVLKIGAEGGISTLHQAELRFAAPLYSLRCLAADAQGVIYVGDSGSRDVFRLAQDGAPQPLTVTADQKGLIDIPLGVAIGEAGELYVTDLEQHCVWKVTAEGKAEKFAAVTAPSGIARDAQGDLWVTSRNQPQLVKISLSGESQTIVAGDVFQLPHAVAVAADGTAYVADGYGRCIWKVTAGQPPQKWLSDPQLVNPTGLCWRGEELVIADPRSSAKLWTASPEGSLSPLLK